MKLGPKTKAFLIPTLVGAIVFPLVNLGFQYGAETRLFDLPELYRLILECGAYFGFGLFFVVSFLLKKQYAEMTWALLGFVLGTGLALVISVVLFFSLICSFAHGGC